MDSDSKYCKFCGSELFWKVLQQWEQFNDKQGHKELHKYEILQCHNAASGFGSLFSKKHPQPFNDWGEYAYGTPIERHSIEVLN